MVKNQTLLQLFDNPVLYQTPVITSKINTLAVGIVTLPKDNYVQLWSPKDGKLFRPPVTDYSGGKFYKLACSLDGKYLLGGATDYKLWKADGTEVCHARSCASCTPAWGLAWSRDNRA